MKRVLCLLLCGCLLFTVTSCGKPGYDDRYIEDTETEEITDYENESEHYDYVDVTDYDITAEPLYQELYPEYVEVLDNIEHDDGTYQKFLDAFDLMYRNYDYLYSVFKVRGFKTKEEYIREDMIGNLRDEILKISNSTWNGEPTTNSGQYTGDHIFVADEADERTVIHELSHCNDDMDTYDFYFYYIFSEGRAVFQEQLCFHDCIVNGIDFGDYYVREYNGRNYFIRGIEKTDFGYVLYGKCFSTLACLVDFDVINRAIEDIKQSYIEDFLRDKYGNDAGKLFGILKEITGYAFEDDYENPGIIKNLIEVEKLVNYCFYQSISKAESAEELKEILDLRCYYNKQLATRELLNYVPPVEDPFSPPEFDVALETDLDPYGVEDHLYEKCMDFDMFNLDDNETGHLVFNMLIGHNPNYFSSYSFNEARTMTDASICISKDGKYLTVFHNDVPWTQYDLETGFPRVDYLEISKKAVDNEIVPLIK